MGQDALDRDALKAFAVRLMGVYGGAVLAQMVDLGARTGLTATLADAPGTSDELAERAGLQPRYVEEWLGAMVTGGIVTHDAGVFTLPPEHAACLVGDSFYNTSAMARAIANGNQHNGVLADAFREGGGIAYGDQPGDIVGLLDAMGRARYDTFLVDAYLTVDDELVRLLRDGADVCDVGCGAGHATNLIAQAYPEASVVGVDRNPDALEAARAEAAEMGLDNVRYEVADAADLETGSLDVVTAFDVIHDLSHPRETIAAIAGALRPGGTFLLYDASAPSDLDAQAELPWATMMYGISVNACLANALAGGEDAEGWGPMYPRAGVEQALAEAGFELAGVHPVKGDPMNALYVARR
ncbi:MAG: methyltransferase domain-containing protein [Actinobacteria bacterium]|nr:methyltransferase domain-containing protein [Actinomycetota bacterium]